MWQQTVKQVEWSPDGLIPASQVQSLLNLQAEISYKAGYQACAEKMSSVLPAKFRKAKLAGMKKVVEWVREHGRTTYERAYGEITLDSKNWQAFLKEIET